ncbi:unnamed protein product [Laminaria digitata]
MSRDMANTTADGASACAGGAGGGASASVGVSRSSSTKVAQLSSTAATETSQPRRRTSLHAWFLSRVGGSTKGDMIDDHPEEDGLNNEAPHDVEEETTPQLEHNKAAHGEVSDTEEAEEVTPGTAAAAAAEEASQPIDRNVLIEAIIEHHTPGDDDCTPEIQSCDDGGDKQTPSNGRGPREEEGTRGGPIGLNIMKSRLSASSWAGMFDDRDPPFRELHVYDDDEEFAGSDELDPDHTREVEIEAATSGAKRHVNFLSATMGLTVDVSGALQQPLPEREHATHGDHDDDWPASPCNGMIMETSPRYCVLQTFRKQMCSRGIDGQMFHTGWKGRLLPARNIRLFMTDTRQSSVLYWRYRRKSQQRRRGAAGSGGELGAEDRRIIPLSSLANIGPAELNPRNTTKHHGGDSLWSTWAAAWPRGSKEQSGSSPASKASDGTVEKEDATAGLVEEVVPVLAISYWVEGEPRWVGDEPKRLLLKPESLDGFRRLTDGLRLCCLHFHNHACPQDLEDTQ